MERDGPSENAAQSGDIIDAIVDGDAFRVDDEVAKVAPMPLSVCGGTVRDFRTGGVCEMAAGGFTVLGTEVTVRVDVEAVHAGSEVCDARADTEEASGVIGGWVAGPDGLKGHDAAGGVAGGGAEMANEHG